MRNQKYRKSIVLARWLTILEVSLLLLCNTPGFVEGRSETNAGRGPRSTDGSCRNTCLKPGCIQTVSSVLKNMDPNVNPCDNFYRYACGGFVNQTVVPDGQPKVNYQTILQKKIREQVKSRLQAEIEPDEPRPFKLAKNLYKMCMNESALKDAELEPLRVQLNKLGRWPIFLGHEWDPNEFQWTNTIYKLNDAGYPQNNLIQIGLTVDPVDNSQRIINIDQGELEINPHLVMPATDYYQRYYFEKKRYMVDLAVKLGVNRTRAEKEVRDFFGFQINLANIMERPTKLLRHNPMTLRSLTNMYPSIPWQEYFSSMLPSSITLKDDDIINVNAPTYFTKLESIFAETDKRMQANYLMWRVINFSIKYLNTGLTPYIPAASPYESDLTPSSTESRARSDICYDVVAEQFPFVVGALFARRYIHREAKEKATNIARDIKGVLEVILSDISWMDEETKFKAVDKATEMGINVGYPDEFLDDEKLEDYYKKLDFPGDAYLETTLKLQKFRTNRFLNELREPVSKFTWLHPERSLSAEPLYSYEENNLLIPAGILQSVVFNNGRPNYMNFGAIGFLIGSGITRAFDTEGKKFDGFKKKHNWLSPETDTRYHQRAECLIDQYGFHGQDLYGFGFLKENIGDNGGIRIAYLAYKNWVTRNEAEAKLPGIKGTPEQMFWLSAANTWCAKYSEDGLKSIKPSHAHRPEESRINVAFSNMPEFAHDYNCPVGSTMNPRKKCSFW